jgi:hypothetical protein
VLGAVATLALVSGCSQDDGSGSAQSQASQTLALYENGFFKYASNPNPNNRITFLAGFSFVPPQGENWIEGPRKPDPDPNNYGLVHRLAFLKLLPQDESRGPHTIVANVFTMRVEPQNRTVNPHEFIRFRLRMSMASDKVMKNVKVLSQQGDVDKTLGYECFRYEMAFENYGVVGFRGLPFKVENHIMECMAPSGEFLVRLQYGEMVPPDLQAVGVIREGDGFFKSLQFDSSPQG